MIDSHCHLDVEQFNADRSEVIGRAKQAGVNTIINPGADCFGFEKPVKIAEQFENVYASIGVHPEGIKNITEAFWLRFAELLKHPKVVAVGEIGLEKNERLPSLEEQIPAMLRFITLAVAHNKPIIFHVRYVHKEFQQIIRENNFKLNAVIHSFTGTPGEAKFYLDQGYYLGIAGMVTFPKADEIRAVVKDLPLERLLIETDAPFLAPQVVRGQRNEPAYVVEIAKKIAEIKGISVEEVAQVTEANTRKLFGIE
ncbi:MAG: TatD family hydrolase [bacterium]|nr:TatD family hydrolase [bacterium]